MAETKQYTCDGCGAVKGSTNHWWRAVSGVTWTMHPWDLPEEFIADPEMKVLHICGEQCAIKKFSEFMGRRNG